jgi:hypothetical protein
MQLIISLWLFLEQINGNKEILVCFTEYYY